MVAGTAVAITPEYIDYLMSNAYSEAHKAGRLGEVPVGAVVSCGDRIISRAHNLTERLHDATAHAEILALQVASAKLKSWRLNDSILCVTLEPCTMCIGAIKAARVPVVIFGASDPRAGAVGSIYDLAIDSRTGTPPRVISGIREKECAEILREFFAKRRNDSRPVDSRDSLRTN